LSDLHPFLRPITLGRGVVLPNRVFPAPMEGILTPLFCKALERQNLVHMWMTPFVRLGGELPRRRKLLRMIEHFMESNKPLIVQLMGRDADVMAEAAAIFVEEGAVGINYNFACPSKVVIKHGSGGGLLRQPKFMAEAVDKTAALCPGIPVSIKMRTGVESPTECVEVLKHLRDSACAMIMLHHRTVSESYKKVDGRLERYALAREAWPDRDLVLSGDILSVDQVLKIDPCPYDGVMVARGMIKRPLLIREIHRALESGRHMDPGEEVLHREALDFLSLLLNICLEDVDRFWSSKYMLEMGRHLFGKESSTFREMIQVINGNGGPMDLLDMLSSKG
jgi:tRNA-dihydrouridine synthase